MTTKETPRKQKHRIIGIAALASIAALLMQTGTGGNEFLSANRTMKRAVRIMEQALDTVNRYCREHGIAIDPLLDPNATGLIGPGESGLTTTVGHLQAKRTTTNPAMAALIVLLLKKAGVKQGESIAVASSGSFPALLIAVRSAARAMSLRPLIILSVGASSYGATRPGFHILDIDGLLRREEIFFDPPIAVSLGGEDDIGGDFDPEILKAVGLDLEASGILCIRQSNLKRNVEQRMKIYLRESGSSQITAFVNAGGSEASLGTSALVLRVKPGLNLSLTLPPINQRGVLFAMAARDIPVIHLLFIKGLAQRYGIPWDPIPLNGGVKPRDPELESHSRFWLVFALYFTSLFIIWKNGKKGRFQIRKGKNQFD